MQAAITENMKTKDFNAEAKAPHYGYARSPVHARAFQILKYKEGRQDGPVPVGDYTVLDSNEDLALSERKVMNLVALLNGRKALMQLGHETGARVLYHLLPETDEDGKQRVLFYHLGQEGVSVENALFRIEKDENVT